MKKEPFLQVSKRRNKAGWQERLLIRFIALILALIVCGAVIVALVKMNPVDVLLSSCYDLCWGQNADRITFDRNVCGKCTWRNDLGNDPGCI